MPGSAPSHQDWLRNVTRVFFDFSGTVVEGVPNWEHPQLVACAEWGLDVTPAQVKAAIWKVWGPLEACAHPEASADESTYADWIGRSVAAMVGEILGARARRYCWRILTGHPQVAARLGARASCPRGRAGLGRAGCPRPQASRRCFEARRCRQRCGRFAPWA